MLCLHGAGANIDVAQLQLHVLNVPAELHFIQAPHTAVAFAETLEGAYSWFSDGLNDGTMSPAQETELLHSLNFVLLHIESHGPYDGAYGFSQGAAVVAALCSERVLTRLGRKHPPFSFVVLACGVERGVLRHLDAELPLRTASLHLIGDGDPLQDESHRLAQSFSNAAVVHHPYAHALPMELRNSAVCASVAAFVVSGGQAPPTVTAVASEESSVIKRSSLLSATSLGRSAAQRSDMELQERTVRTTFGTGRSSAAAGRSTVGTGRTTLGEGTMGERTSRSASLASSYLRQTFAKCIASAAADATCALSLEGQPVEISWARLVQTASQLAVQLSDQGVRAGGVCVLCFYNTVENVVTWLALLLLGAVAAPVGPHCPHAEAAYYIGDLNPSLFLTQQSSASEPSCCDFAAAVDAAAADRGVRRATLRVQLDEPLAASDASAHTKQPVSALPCDLQVQHESTASAAAPAETPLTDAGQVLAGAGALKPDAPAALLYTTDGTAATKPRAIRLSQRNLLAGARAVAEAFELTADDSTLCVMPFYHVHGLVTSLLSAVVARSRMVLPKSGAFDYRSFWQAVADHHVSWYSAVPAIHSILLKHRQLHEAAMRPSLRLVASSCGSGTLSTDALAAFKRDFGVDVLEGWALVETSQLITMNQPSACVLGTVGAAVDGIELRLDEETGEVWVRGEAVAVEALDGERLCDEQGWLRTGFRSKWHPDHRGVLLHPRAPDYINKGGNKMFPAEIEQAADGFGGPAAGKLVAFACAHAELGQIVGVVVQTELTPPLPTLAELVGRCADAGLRAEWLPEVLVLSAAPIPHGRCAPGWDQEGLATALGLPEFRGRTHATFVVEGAGQLRRLDAAETAAATAAAGERATSEAQETAEALVLGGFERVLGQTGLDPTSNFFERGGGSLQVLSLQAYILAPPPPSSGGRDWPVELRHKVPQHVFFLRPTVRELAAYLLAQSTDGSGGETVASVAAPLPLPGVHADGEWVAASFPQEQMYVVDSGSDSGAAYNMPWVVLFTGNFDRRAMLSAYEHTVRREQPLRTLLRYNAERRRVEQRVLPPQEHAACWQLVEHEATSVEAAVALLNEAQDFRFDVRAAPISRLDLVRVSDTQTLVMVNGHHVNHDTWSNVNHRHCLLEAYTQIASGAQPPSDDEREYTYLAWSAWQHKVLRPNSAELERQLQYWREELAGVPQRIELPLDKPPVAVPSNRGGLVPLHVSAEAVKEWRATLARHGCTLFMGALAVFHLLLARWTGETDIVTGAATSNRNAHSAYSQNLGYFANILAIRSNTAGALTWDALLEQLRSKVLDAWAAQDVPFHMVVPHATPSDGSSWRSFNCMYALQEYSWHSIDVDTSAAGVTAEIVRLDKNLTKFDVHLMLRERADGGLDGDLIYSDDRFTVGTMTRFAAHFSQLCVAVASPSAARVNVRTLQMLSVEEEEQLRTEWNQSTPTPPFPPARALLATIEEAATEHTHRVAIMEAQGRVWTYEQLQAHYRSLSAGISRSIAMAEGAHASLSAALTVGRIALAFEKSLEMYAAVLGVLAAGGTYVPIDVAHTPLARVVFMVQDAAADMLLCGEGHYSLVETCSVAVDEWMPPPMHTFAELVADGAAHLGIDIAAGKYACPTFVLGAAARDPDAVATIMYTSGTTGLPKGVLIHHANVHNSIHWWSRMVELSAEDRVLQFSSYSFVMSLRQIFPTFAAGATLVLPHSAAEFGEAVETAKVTKMCLTPSALSTLEPERCPALKVVQVAGEAPTLQLATRWSAHLDAFYIGLGPTELCGHACCGRFDPATGINIGMPVSNVAAYILNEEGCLQPVGVTGELCVAGEDVSHGYLNRPELTAKSFVGNPFDASKPRMYKVGDLARRLPSGRVQFVGRRDAQVKIRGFRVELAEVVNTLLLAPELQRVEVLLVDGVLVAYVTPQVSTQVVERVRHGVANLLPDYMVPTHIVPLAAFPLNKNGKLDRAKLPMPALDSGDAVDIGAAPILDPAAHARVREQLLPKWARSLGIEPDAYPSGRSYFALGGTSLSAIVLMREMNAALGTELKVAALFEHDTLDSFVSHVLPMLDPSSALVVDAAVRGDDEGLGVDKDLDVVQADRAAALSQPIGKPLPRLVVDLLVLCGVATILFTIIVPAAGGVLAAYIVQQYLGPPTLLLAPGLYLAAVWTHVLLAAVVLRLLCASAFAHHIGHEGTYALWSGRFVLWWMVRRLMGVTQAVLWCVSGTPMIVWAYRTLGASIGAGVTLENPYIDVPPLVSIGDGCSLNNGARLIAGEMLGQALVLRRVTLGRRVLVQPRAVVAGGARVSDGFVLLAWSCATAALPARATPCAVHGSPATIRSELPERETAARQALTPEFSHRLPFVIVQLCSVYLLVLLNFIGVGAALLLGIEGFRHVGSAAQQAYFIAIFPWLALVLVLTVNVLSKHVVLHATIPNRVHSGAFFYWRVWFVDQLLLSPLVALALEYLVPESLFRHYVLLLGGSVGKRAFWNRPELRAGVEHLHIGNTLHAGMQQMWTTEEVDTDGVTFRPIVIGDKCTIGQRSVVMPGVECGDCVTVGSEGTLYSAMAITAHATVFGSPPTVFASAASDEAQVKQLQKAIEAEEGRAGSGKNQQPTASAVEADPVVGDDEGAEHCFSAVALLINFLKLPLIVAVYFSAYLAFYEPIAWRDTFGDLGSHPSVRDVGYYVAYLIVIVSLTYILGTFVIALSLVLLTRCGPASFRKGFTGYYSLRFTVWWVCAWLNRFTSGTLLYPWHGTRIFNLWLHAMGATVGKGAFLDPGSVGFFEIDNITFGRESIVLTPNVHGHFVDHQKLQFAPVRVGARARVNDGATVMPFTTLADDVVLRAHCTTVKGQNLQTGVYMGSPAERPFSLPVASTHHADSVGRHDARA